MASKCQHFPYPKSVLTVVSDLPEGRDLGLVVVGLSTSPCSCFITSYVLGSSKSPFFTQKLVSPVSAQAFMI